jgi:tripartite-type tricarboxylate transporter receptor subunit TctC
VRIVVGFAPGDPNDILARLIGQWLSERLGQPFIVENRPGAGSNLGTESVVRAPSDGHTLLMFGPSAAINAKLYSNLKYNFIRDIAPVAGILRLPLAVVVHPSVTATTIRELATYAASNPGKFTYASPGTGTLPHAAGELFRMMAGVTITHVPYRGAANALTDLLSGQVHSMFTGAASGYIKDGRLRPLAVTTDARSPELPDIPTVAEFLPGYETSAWFGIGAPQNTPTEIVTILNEQVNAALADAKFNARLADLGGKGLPGSPADFGKLIANETEKWAKVIKFAGMTAN